MTWTNLPMVAFDLETTSVDPETARIVTACVVKIDGSEIETRDWLVDPGVEIPAEAAAIHGVSTEQAQADGIHPAIAAVQIFAELDEAWSLGRPVVAFNASYDLTVLDRELRRHCGTFLGGPGPVVDPFVIDKQLDRYRKGKRTLGACCEHYQVRLDGAHTSSGDAIAAARLAWRLANVYPDDVGDRSLAELHADQQRWRADWAAEFEQYLIRKGTPEPVDGSWPLRPHAEAVTV